ncbi:MAG: hypothetical protein ACE5J2_07215 [Nitrososphaerales archaeon]
MKGSKVAIVAGIGGIVTAIAVGIVLALTQTSSSNELVSNFPIRVDFARVVPYENRTNYPDFTRGYVMNIRLFYSEEGPPRPFYLLLTQQGETWDRVTDPEQWVKQKYHGFEVLSSSKEFDLFTEYYPFDSSLLPYQMRLYCSNCTEQWSEPQIVWQGVDNRITKLKVFSVRQGVQFYNVVFVLANSQIDTLPASGTVEFRLTDSIGVSLFETQFKVKNTDFRPADEPIRLLRVPMGGKAYLGFSFPADQITPSPSGKTTGFAFLNFILEDGRILSGGTRGVKLPPI